MFFENYSFCGETQDIQEELLEFHFYYEILPEICGAILGVTVGIINSKYNLF
jgi:hypothetical protein